MAPIAMCLSLVAVEMSTTAGVTAAVAVAEGLARQ
jgi:hypothetical protein